MRTYIKELCDNAFAIVPDAEDSLEGRPKIHRVHVVAIFGHAREQNHHEHHGNHDSYDDVRLYQHTQVGLLDKLEFGVGKLRAGGGVHRVQLCLDEVHGHEHSAE